MRSKLLLVTGLTWATFATQAQTSLTLQQAVELAKKNNYTMQNSKLDQELAVKRVKEVAAQGLPQINASGSFNDYIDLPTQVVGADAFAMPGQPKAPANTYLALQFGLPFSAVGTLSASQLLFDGTYFLGLKAAKEFVNLARLGTKRTELEVTTAVTKMYFAALITQANVKMLDNTLVSLDKTLSDNRAYYKSGLIEKIDLDRVELAQSNTKISRDKLSDQYRIAMFTLKLQLGLNVADSVVLADDLEKLYDASLATGFSEEINYRARPDYQMLEQQVRLQGYDIRRYKYGYYPTLNASFIHQRTSFGPDIGSLGTVLPSVPGSPDPITQAWFPSTIFSLNLNLPIFDGFRKSAQIQQSKITLMKYENDKRNLENNIQSEVAQLRLRYERAKQQLEIQKKNMELAQEIYKRAGIKYQSGVGSSLELSTAENEMKTAQTNYLSSMYDMLVSQLDLRKSLGLLN